MSFFEKLAHQKSANSGDAPRQAFSVSITHAADVDEFAEALRPFSAQSVQTQLAGVLISAAQCERAVVHSGQAPSGRLTSAVGTSRTGNDVRLGLAICCQ